MRTQRERDAEWAHRVRLAIAARKAQQGTGAGMSEDRRPAVLDEWSRRGEESQDPGGWEAA